MLYRSLEACALVGGISAGMGANAMAIGAKILKGTGYDGYDVGQAAAAGAVGNAVIGGGLGLLAGLVAPDTGTGRREAVDVGLWLMVSGIAVSGVVGALILGATGHDHMEVDKLFAASVCGSCIAHSGYYAVKLFPRAFRTRGNSGGNSGGDNQVEIELV